MSFSAQPGAALLAYTRDHILAGRSGYHTIAHYLKGSELIVAARGDPTHGLKRFGTRVLRRLAFSRWYTGGSGVMEWKLRQRLKQGFAGPVHLLWCDRDMGFADLLVDHVRQPLVGTFHQCVDELPRIVRRSSALKKFAAIILMSETQRPYFIEQGVAEERLHCILHGVDTEHFTPRSTSSGQGFTVLSVGGTRRDFSLMREVAHRLRDVAAIRLEIVGPNDRRVLFEGLPHVTYMSGISDESLLERYRSAGCYLHLADAATANNALLEGLSCGLPVITQPVGGIPEYVTADCAMLCAPNDAPSVVAALDRLAASPELQSAMRTAARAHALTLDWRHAARQTQMLYQNLN